MTRLEEFLLSRMTVRRWIVAMFVVALTGVAGGWLAGMRVERHKLETDSEHAGEIAGEEFMAGMQRAGVPENVASGIVDAGRARAQKTASAIHDFSTLQQEMFDRVRDGRLTPDEAQRRTDEYMVNEKKMSREEARKIALK